MGDNKQETSLPEPPKFNVEDLPEPPRLEPIGSEPLVPEKNDFDMDVPDPVGNSDPGAIPPPPKMSMPSMPEPPTNAPKDALPTPPQLSTPPKVPKDTPDNMPEPPTDNKEPSSQKESGQKLGFLKKIFGKKEKEEKIDIKPSKNTEQVNLNPLSEDSFAPPGFQDQTPSPSKKDTLANAMPPQLGEDKDVAPTDEKLPPPPQMQHPSEKPENLTPRTEPVPKFDDKEFKPGTTVHHDASIPKPPSKPKSIDEVSFDTKPDVDWFKEGVSFEEKEEKVEGEDYVKEEEAEEFIETPLTKVKGVGKKTAEKLKGSGVESAEHLADHDHEELSQKTGLSSAVAKKIVKEAKKVSKKHKTTPLKKVKGVGKKREKKLKDAGIETAEELAEHDHKTVAEKAKIPKHHAKKIVSHAKKIAKIKKDLKKKSKKHKTSKKAISDIVKDLEKERKAVEALEKKGEINEDKIIQIQGHKDIIDVLKKLEKKREELIKHEEELNEKESKLSNHEEAYKRDVDNIEKLKRRLDHDVRERTQYLINLEKEYFAKAQKLAKKESEVEVKHKSIEEREGDLKEQEEELKKRANELEDRAITLETKEEKLEKIMQDLGKQDDMLKEKEEDLLAREEEYTKKLDALEKHEQAVLEKLERKRERLEAKEKEVNLKDRQLQRKEKNLDKKSVAIEYANEIMERQKGKLIDDEFDQYLEDQLRGVKGGLGLDDVELTSNINWKSKKSKGTIYDMIDTCKDLLQNDKLPEAKVFYNKIRQKYYDYNFSSKKEKENLHNIIRSLYDEINLAEIGSNA